MYWRARAFSGVPMGRLPMVPASICTCARAFSSEKWGGVLAQAEQASRRTGRATRRGQLIPHSVAQVVPLPPQRGAARAGGSVAYPHVAAEGLEVVVAAAAADVAGDAA